jgi:DNA integrity scanning protein DisA with diadenylate cyclase activity/mannitol/fructose-specific phosphotransferase system IIA component (Ntr-type)
VTAKHRSGSSAAATNVEERLSRYLRPGAVLDTSAGSKEELLRALSEVVVEDASEDVVERIYEAIQEREASVNTYVGEGVAIPHARVDCVDGIAIALARNPEGFPYGLETDQPVRIVFLVVGNEHFTDEHVRILGLIANVLKNDELREKLLQAPDVGAIMKLLDSPGKGTFRRSARPLSQLLLSYTRQIGRELGIHAIIISVEAIEDLALFRRLPGRKSFIVATSSRRIFEEAEKTGGRALLLPQMPLRREARLRLAALMALTNGHILRGEVVAFLSGDPSGGLDSMTILEIGREFGKFVTPSGVLAAAVLPGVLERVLGIAAELSREGREGRPVGTIFVVGDPEDLTPFCQQMVMNPFRGYPEEERNILDPTLKETIKEFAAIDGAFVVRGDGVVFSAGTYLKVSRDVSLPGGYGSRHRAACAISDAANCLAVALSQSTGEVTLFQKGAVLLNLDRGGGR